MTRFIALTAAGVAVLALAACNEPRPEETETAAAFPGADAVAPAPATGTAPPAGAASRAESGDMTPEEGPPPYPTPTLPPESGSPTSGAVSPPER